MYFIENPNLVISHLCILVAVHIRAGWPIFVGVVEASDLWARPLYPAITGAVGHERGRRVHEAGLPYVEQACSIATVESVAHWVARQLPRLVRSTGDRGGIMYSCCRVSFESFDADL